MSLPINRILIHYGEIGLKGKNRANFTGQLCNNIRYRLRPLDWPVKRTYDRLYVEVPARYDEMLNEVLSAIGEVAGIANFTAAHWIAAQRIRQTTQTPDYALIENTVLEMVCAPEEPEATFCVRVKRADKRFPMPSNELEKALGSAIIRNTAWWRVSLTDPNQPFNIDIHPEGCYFYCGKIKGMGGLPVHSSGRVLVLLSGGIDSPVAAYLAAKNGCSVDFVHFSATLIQQQSALQNKVAEIARALSRYTLRSRLYLVPYLYFDTALLGAKTSYELILFRRFMARVAQALLPTVGAKALVAGDSLGQVASQTLDNLVCLSRAVEVPIFRPLLTYDKQQIIDLSRKLGLFDLSIKPYKDCCAILSRHPKTSSEHERITEIEHQLLPGYEKLIADTLADAVMLEFDCGKLAPALSEAEG
jgi:thiazole biosynthesis/tRNA modification protein ThiI